MFCGIGVVHLCFWKVLLLNIYSLFKNPTLFSYDADKIILKNGSISREDIADVGWIYGADAGFLGIESYALAIQCNDEEVIYIPKKQGS